jgi:hypothetical protein
VLRFLAGSQVIDTNLGGLFSSGTGTFDGYSIIYGPNCRVQIGDGSTAMQMDDSIEFAFDGVQCPFANFDFEGSSEAWVYNTGLGQSNLFFSGGAITDLYIKAGRVTLGASYSVSGDVHLLGDDENELELVVLAGAAFTNLYQWAGQSSLAANPTNVYIKRGLCRHVKTSAATVTLVDIDGGVFEVAATDPTYTKINVNGGVANFQHADAATITNMDVWPLGVALLDNDLDSIVTSNAPVSYGGHVVHGPSISPTVKLRPVHRLETLLEGRRGTRFSLGSGSGSGGGGVGGFGGSTGGTFGGGL